MKNAAGAARVMDKPRPPAKRRRGVLVVDPDGNRYRIWDLKGGGCRVKPVRP